MRLVQQQGLPKESRVGVYVIKLLGLSDGRNTPFDGQYLVEYDPEQDGVDPNGDPMHAHVVCSPNIAEAKRYLGVRAVHAEWSRVSQRAPFRADGRPNRPLTAFTCEVVPVLD